MPNSSALSYVGSINIFDADGILVNASSTWPAPDSTSRTGAISNFKTDPQSPDMLVEPVYSRITGVWTTVFARKITGPERRIPRRHRPRHRALQFREILRNPRARQWCGDLDVPSRRNAAGALSARANHDRAEFQARPAVHRHILTDADHGTTRLSDSPTTAVNRLAAGRQLSHFRSSSSPQRPRAAALADWREQTRFLIAMAGLSMLVITAMLYPGGSQAVRPASAVRSSG